MADFKLDRLKFSWKGNWVTDFDYTKDDVVFYQGKAFVALQGHTSSSNFYDDADFAGSKTISVTVNTDTLNSNNSGVFYLNGEELPNLNLIKGKAYVFDQTDSSNVNYNGGANILMFSLGEDGPRNGNERYVKNIFYYINDIEVDYETYVQNFVSAERRKIQLTIPFDAPDKIFVYSHNNSNMGTYFNSRYFSHWELIFDGRSFKNSWSIGTFYSESNVVRYNGNVYICVEPHVSTIELADGLEADIEKWNLLSSVDTWASAWQPDNKYTVNDVVKYGGRLYRCIEGHTSQSDIAGLESDASKWENISDSIEYKGEWTADVKYKQNDVVKYGPSLYLCDVAHVSSNSLNELRQDIANWSLYVPGLKIDEIYDSNKEYSTGDIVVYGGFTYVALAPNKGSIPSVNGKLQDIGDWEVLVTGYNLRGDFVEEVEYKVGDVVRYAGSLFVAENDLGGDPAETENWVKIIDSKLFKGRWNEGVLYARGEVVTFIDTAYVCISPHDSNEEDSRPDIDEDNQVYWNTVIEGAETNVLRTEGDMKQKGELSYDERLPIGVAKSVFTASEEERQVIEYEVSVETNEQAPGNNVFVLNGYQYPSFDLKRGTKYVFNQNDVSNDTHPLIFSETQNGTHSGGVPYEIDVVYKLDGAEVVDADAYNTGFGAATTRSVEIMPTVYSPGTLYYYCYNHSNMNPTGVISVVSSIIKNKWQLLTDSPRSFYVSLDGTDDPSYGKSEESPWRTVSYAANYLLQNVYGTFNTTTIGGDYILQFALNIIANDQDTSSFSALADLLNSVNPTTMELYGNINKTTEGITQEDGIAAQNYYAGNIVSVDIQNRIKAIEKFIYYNTEQFINDSVTVNGVEYSVLNTVPPNTTIYVKTGVFEEILPIRIPENCALVGEELRSTTISPAAGYEESDMFYVRNSSGIRNMTMSGLSGTLGPLNQYITRRPTAGAYVSLDPGTGPSDSTVWITTRSPYIQNVTTLGTACIGVKIDGALHSGGNKSITANDFTQVLSDGIGAWADNLGRSELVSVFTYYNHIGYLCTNGGIIRATNGNNSYGTYGSVAEGFDETEIPINGTINNRTEDAQFAEAFTFGVNEQSIIAVGYSHAGQDYTSANVTFGGSGTGASGYYSEFRDGAISNIRIRDPQDSTQAGGVNYTLAINNLQEGNDGRILLAQSEVGSAEQFVGQRIVILSGLGVGQYGVINSYDPDTKLCVVERESDGQEGFDHFQPGWPIETLLDATSRYAIEPRIDVTEPPFSTSTVAGPSNRNWKYLATNGVRTVAFSRGGPVSDAYSAYSNDGIIWQTEESVSANTEIAGLTHSGTFFLAAKETKNSAPTNELSISVDGISWSDITLPATANWKDIDSDGDGNVVVIPGNGDQTFVYSGDGGQNYNSLTNVGTTQTWAVVGAGNGTFVVLDSTNGDVAVSTNGGASWTIETAKVPAYEYTGITYGNGRFVAVAPSSATGGNPVFVRSFDGINWYTAEEPIGDYSHVSYGQGVFIATGSGSTVAKSAGGRVWRTVDDGSTQFTLTQSGTWGESLFYGGFWVAVQESGIWNRINTGARAVIRAKVEAASVTGFTIFDPGSNYTDSTQPDIQVIDNSNTGLVVFDTFVNDGVLAQPEMTDRGEGYFTATAKFTGNGFAEIYQTGTVLNISGAGRIPGPGANLLIDGIPQQFSVTRVNDQTGTGPYDLELLIRPGLGIEDSPDHLTTLIIRERYSQLRITGHDFLDIGTGNFGDTNYPNLYVFGEDSENPRQPFNETVANGGGRVFYTSTDQDGNFRAGELFAVDQSSGTVTIDASQFDLSGLTELSLGGIQLGGTNVIIREFSKDPTFIANSNNIVPTQRAIKSFLESRLSQGDSNATTNRLIAGQTIISTNEFSNAALLEIKVANKLNIIGGIDGDYLAAQFLAHGSNY